MVSIQLVEKARLHVRRHFAGHIPNWMRFHDLEHTLTVTRWSQDIGRHCGLTEDQLRIVELAALFHDAGYATAYRGHEAKSARLAAAFLKENKAPARLIARVRALIMATRVGERPRGLLQQVLRDADSAKAGQVDFAARSEDLRLELQHARGKRIGASAWRKENLAYLQGHRFFTPYAAQRFAKQKAINLRRLSEEGATIAPAPAATNEQDRYFDRDLSWLAFNARVLQEAEDKRVPLLDRLKFLAIHSSNLDEFYRVRVAQLRSLRQLGKRDRSALDVPPEKRIAGLNKEALRQQRRFGKEYRQHILPGLERHGIRFLDPDHLSRAQRTHVQRFFTERIAPLLQTASLREGNAPFIEDRKLYLLCDLAQKNGRKRKQVLVNVPSDELGRFIVLPPARAGARKRTDLLFLDDAIRLCAPLFFTGYKLMGCHAIKLSRDAELYLDEEFAESVVDKVRRSLRKRRTGVPSRFLYDAAMPPRLLAELRSLLGVRRADLIQGGRYHNFSDLMALPVGGHADLREKPLPPLPHPAFVQADPFAVVRRADRLIHFPYQDFRTLVDLLKRAAADPHVKRISMTLYRVARGSLICEALLAAARAGKKVTVFVEVQARFDEGNNLFWGEALEQEGAHVIYSREGLKVHCKLLLIERRKDRHVERLAYLGTGNFNERTAQVYADIGLFTMHGGITRDVASVFDHLVDPRRPVKAQHLLVAPIGLRSGLERLIDREIANALSGRPAAISLKLNSVEDQPLIAKLYDASRAGVRIRMIVRGICCLVPGVPGLSDHIDVISIVDRFLEHARVYAFHNNGRPQVLLSSADLMQRNMDRRVETAFPILDAALCKEVLDYFDEQWRDTAKARTIDALQRNHYRDPQHGKTRAFRSQMALYERLKSTARKRR